MNGNNGTNVTDVTVPLGGEDWEVALFALIGVIGTLNNGFTFIVIISSKAMREKVTNKMIMNQTAIDWIASVLFIANAPTVRYGKIPPGVHPELYCRLWVSNYFMWSVLNALSFNLVALTLERYFGVVHPAIYRKFTLTKAKLAMAGVWVLGYAITLPYIFISEVEVGKNHTTCKDLPEEPNTFSRISGVVNYILVFLGPVIAMIYCYSCMIRVIRKRVHNGDEDKQSSAERQRSIKMQKLQTNILKTFIMVSVAFIVCWAPSMTILVVYNIGYIKVKFLTSREMKALLFLTYANCCMNPFIYTFQYHDFQVAMKDLKRVILRQNTPVKWPAADAETSEMSRSTHSTH